MLLWTDNLMITAIDIICNRLIVNLGHLDKLCDCYSKSVAEIIQWAVQVTR